MVDSFLLLEIFPKKTCANWQEDIKNPSKAVQKIISKPLQQPMVAVSSHTTVIQAPPFIPNTSSRINYFTDDMTRESTLKNLLLFMFKTVHHFNSNKNFNGPENLEALRPKLFIVSSFSLFYKYYFDIDLFSKLPAFILSCIYIAGKVSLSQFLNYIFLF